VRYSRRRDATGRAAAHGGRRPNPSVPPGRTSTERRLAREQRGGVGAAQARRGGMPLSGKKAKPLGLWKKGRPANVTVN
jgi:hypothetical protein